MAAQPGREATLATAPRLITLILLLQRQPNQKAAQLSEKLGVSVRTLHRYLGMLDEMGIPVYSERGPNGGFSLVRGYRLPPLVFTPEEAVAVSLGTGLVEEMWGQLYREAARGALAKLENVLPDEQRGEIAWARRSLAATGLNRADLDALAPLLEVLRRGVHQQRVVSMRYFSGSSEQPRQRCVDPYALVHRWGWWYLAGYCHLRKAVRSFRVDRMESLVLLDERFSTPADFDVRAYLAQEFASQPQIAATLRFEPAAAHVARLNRVAWETLREEPDGSVTVTLLSPDLGWAASSTLAYGPLVSVLEPPELRQMVRAWAAEITRMNT
ncbi:predicted transcriptional regulator [Longilinea arvoryzae]|uniref:Predicted transcriptional regulator n=1 Tax=Longilinea arvoryzae TaxID=360412 RepID=A0A0S7B5X4_9CHLR|nr:YafY family protein [Longilinea arvoryzae]GAP12556.1 predicted transcriptional regulator [Longilinea arvoryzae]